MEFIASTPKTTLSEDLLKFGLITESQAQKLDEDRQNSQTTLTEGDEGKKAESDHEKDMADDGDDKEESLDHEKGNGEVAEGSDEDEMDDDEDEDEDEDEMDEDFYTLGDYVSECEDLSSSVESALQVIEQFSNLDDEALSSLTVAQMAGVAEAYASLLDLELDLEEDEDLEEGKGKRRKMSSAARTAARKNVRRARRKAKRMKRMGKVSKQKLKAGRRGKEVIDGKEVTKQQAKQIMRKKARGAGGGRGKSKERARAKLKNLRTQTKQDVRARFTGMKAMGSDVNAHDNLAEQNAFEGIIQSLEQLTSPLAVENNNQPSQNQVAEGFNKVRESASEIAERIAAEIRVREDVNEDSDIVKAGLYFEGLAHDADRQARAFKRGEIDENTAVGDLGVLFGDLKKGMEDLATIE